MKRFTSGLFDTLEGQLAEARDFALDVPSISDQSYSYEHFVCCLALIRQAQLTVADLKDYVARLEGDEPGISGAAKRIRDDAVRVQREAEALIEDDEPSVGDVREAADDPVALARAMQQKRHGASP